ncbi:2-C-methyl-D-erythritol 4-phosphate cytidylyltransferase [Planctomycetaceae bacterium SH139]
MSSSRISEAPLSPIWPPGSVAAILPAAGKSRRFGGSGKKIFELLDDRPVWFHAAAALRRRPEVGTIVLVIDPADEPIWREQFQSAIELLDARLVLGGAERADSVLAGLAAAERAAWIAIHDAARPLISGDDIGRVFAAAAETGAALLATRVRGTIKRQQPPRNAAEIAQVQATVDRSQLWEALTPQVFRAELIRGAYAKWRGFPVTDDAQLVERMGHAVSLVKGSPMNLKITVSDDLSIAKALFAARD